MSALPRSCPLLGPGSRAAVRRYHALNPWLDRGDLEQEAIVVAIEASATWREDGTTIDLWVAWKVGLRLSRFVAEQRCPTSLPKRKGASWREAACATRAELTGETPDTSESPDDALDRARAAAKVRAILEQATDAARAVLLAEEKSAAVASRLGMSVRQVYDQTARAMLALRAAFAMEAA